MLIEATVIRYLSRALKDPVYAERPKDRPMRYYLVEKVGGGSDGRLAHSTIAIQSISVARDDNSLLEAAQMNERMKAAVVNDNGGILSESTVTKARLNSDYNNTDPEAGEYKYQAVFDIWHY